MFKFLHAYYVKHLIVTVKLALKKIYVLNANYQKCFIMIERNV